MTGVASPVAYSNPSQTRWLTMFTYTNAPRFKHLLWPPTCNYWVHDGQVARVWHSHPFGPSSVQSGNGVFSTTMWPPKRAPLHFPHGTVQYLMCIYPNRLEKKYGYNEENWLINDFLKVKQVEQRNYWKPKFLWTGPQFEPKSSCFPEDFLMAEWQNWSTLLLLDLNVHESHTSQAVNECYICMI